MKQIQCYLAGCLLTSAALIAQTAHADESPTGVMKLQQATKANESVATAGFETATTKSTEKPKDATELKLSAGGLLATGNARSVAGNATTKLRVRRDQNQLSAAIAANYARSASAVDADTAVTVENYQGKSRYDRFLAGNFAAFVSISGLRDRFQGLDLRLNLDPGLAYYVVDEAKQQLWAEAGYDLQYDVRRGQKIRESFAAGLPLEKTEVRHSGRLFLGYSNNLNKAATLETGLEYLQAFSDTDNWRLNWTVAFNTAIGGNFSIATTFNLKYDNNPLSGVKNTDSITAISLVYQLL